MRTHIRTHRPHSGSERPVLPPARAAMACEGHGPSSYLASTCPPYRMRPCDVTTHAAAGSRQPGSPKVRRRLATRHLPNLQLRPILGLAHPAVQQRTAPSTLREPSPKRREPRAASARKQRHVAPKSPLKLDCNKSELKSKLKSRYCVVKHTGLQTRMVQSQIWLLCSSQVPG